jgi:general secretion pathway protein B
MSYILDALKKAERDRAITSVPALMAVHELQATGRNRRLAVGGGLLLGAAAVFWLLLNSLGTIRRPPPRVGAEHNRAAAPAEPERAEGSTPTQGAPPVPAASEPAASPVPDPSHDAPVPALPESRPGSRSAAAPQPKAEIAPVPPAILAPTEMAPPPPPAASPAKTVPLREATAGMKMSILVYAQAQADRLVFINGRRYAEGDYVDELYLLESITPEGAVLSYGGEKLLLRPGAK